MRTFGHQRPVREGGVIMRYVSSPVCAVTREPLGGAFGKEKKKRLVVTCAAGDVLEFRPLGALQRRTVRLTAADAYRYALTCAAAAFKRKVKEYVKTMTRKEANRKARRELGL